MFFFDFSRWNHSFLRFFTHPHNSEFTSGLFTSLQFFRDGFQYLFSKKPSAWPIIAFTEDLTVSEVKPCLKSGETVGHSVPKKLVHLVTSDVVQQEKIAQKLSDLVASAFRRKKRICEDEHQASMNIYPPMALAIYPGSVENGRKNGLANRSF